MSGRKQKTGSKTQRPAARPKLFAPGETVNGHADMGWAVRFSSDDDLAEGYRLAADNVVRGATEGGESTELMFFPAALLYRHAVELLLKECIRYGQKLGVPLSNRGGDALAGSHSLGKLWPRFLDVVQARLPFEAEDRAMLEEAEQIVNEFDKYDPAGMAFRYSRDKEGQKKLLEGLPPLVCLTQMQNVANRLIDFLSACVATLDHVLHAGDGL